MFYGLIFVTLALGMFHRIEIVAAALAIASTSYLCLALAAQRLHFGFPALSTDFGRLTLLDYGCYFALGVTLWLTFFDRATIQRVVIAGVAALGGAAQIVFACRAFSRTEPVLLPEAIWAAAIALVAVSAWQAALIARLLRMVARPIRLLGLATYPLYLLHDDLGGAIRGGAAQALGHPTLMACLAGALAVAASLAVAAWLEPPLQRLVRKALAHLPGGGSRPVVTDRTHGQGTIDRRA